MPPRILSYLWDISTENLDVQKSSTLIIERVLEYGNSEDIAWLEKTYSRDSIIETLKKSRRISAKTANYYSLKYKLDKSEIECFRKPFTQKQHRF